MKARRWQSTNFNNDELFKFASGKTATAFIDAASCLYSFRREFTVIYSLKVDSLWYEHNENNQNCNGDEISIGAPIVVAK